MSNAWTTPGELRERVARLWRRGVLPAALVSNEALFPQRFALKTPTSAELSERFDAARAWIASLQKLPHCRLELRTVKHRVLGSNTLPQAVWIDSADDALALIGKRADAKRLQTVAAALRERQPALLPWLARKPLRALDHGDDWPQLLALIDWLQMRPRPNIYLREIDAAGVDSKFIETRRALLAELLDLVLPADTLDLDAGRGVGGFHRRYGFRDKPQRVRLRLLDAGVAPWATPLGDDISIDAARFATLAPEVRRVLVTENEINFLTLPALPHSLAVFGAGYGFEALADADWLRGCALYYWGDIDTHGFAILDQLRGTHPHARSLLMDRDTLLAHRPQWGEETRPARRTLTRLDADEQALYDDLCRDTIAPRLRLEQERIAYRRVRAALDRLQP